MSQNIRHKKSNDKGGPMEQHADVIHDPSAEKATTMGSVARADTSEVAEAGIGNEENSSKRFSISSILSKRETKDVLPEFAGSSSHNGVLTANSSKDMNLLWN